MKITFLGTGTSQGVPVIACSCEVCKSMDYRDKRLRTSIWIQEKNKSIVIDSGPDFRQQMLRERVKSLDALLFTHEHKDHTAGLDDVRAFNFFSGKHIPIFGKKRVLNQIKQDFHYAFASNKYPGTPEIQLNEVEQELFEVENIPILPIEVMHHQLSVFGYRIENFAYITDANFIPPKAIEQLKNLDVLVLNALRKEKHISHFTLEEAIEVIEDLKPKQAYFTHISHQMGLHSCVSEQLPPNIQLAHDGLQIVI